MAINRQDISKNQKTYTRSQNPPPRSAPDTNLQTTRVTDYTSKENTKQKCSFWNIASMVIHQVDYQRFIIAMMRQKCIKNNLYELEIDFEKKKYKLTEIE